MVRKSQSVWVNIHKKVCAKSSLSCQDLVNLNFYLYCMTFATFSYIFVGYQVNLGHGCCYFLLYTTCFLSFVLMLLGMILGDASIFVLDLNSIWLQWTFATLFFAGS